ncbi:MAG: radical SAM family heme chaperone HemW [Erythrobacter sp.]
MARSVYIHWPFCARKCPYCDFNSHVRDEVDFARWEAALIADLRAEAALVERKPLKSIFFGGGTPSLMSPQLVDQLLTNVAHLWGFADDIEITLEANPSSVEASKFADLAKAGINRVSLGIQSLDNDALQFLGRLHSADEALDALKVAQQNFDRVSFDLIYALPDQTEEHWRSQLERALSFGTSHLSLYQLTIEPSTRFATDVRRGVFEPLDNDRAAGMYEITRELTQQHGLPAYEISNHALVGEESRHNLTYWQYEDYIGIGPGAHGRRNGIATTRHKKPETYLMSCETKSSGIQTAITLSPEEQVSEALLMGLRLTSGIDLESLAARFGIPVLAMLDAKKLDLHQSLGLIWRDGSKIGVTPAGMPVLDALLADLVHADLVSA